MTLEYLAFLTTYDLSGLTCKPANKLCDGICDLLIRQCFHVL